VKKGVIQMRTSKSFVAKGSALGSANKGGGVDFVWTYFTDSPLPQKFNKTIFSCNILEKGGSDYIT